MDKQNILMQLAVFVDMQNVTHSFLVNKFYTVHTGFYLREEDIPGHAIIFQCPIEVYNTYMELMKKIEQTMMPQPVESMETTTKREDV